MGTRRTCSGESQTGKSPPKCSISTPQNRSIEPKGARWIMTGRGGWLSRAAVRQVEPDGEIVVHLDRPELPFAPDHVLDDEVDLWAVERGLPGLLGERN